MPFGVGEPQLGAGVWAFLATNATCAVSGWFGSGIATNVGVLCRTSAGALADAQFTVSYLTNF